ncbi:hypothetical protein MTO96_017812 [Rhipicephalus appendiculatus]
MFAGHLLRRILDRCRSRHLGARPSNCPPLRGSGCDFGTACVFHWASALAVMSLVSTFSFSATSLALLAFFAAIATLVNGIGAFFLLPNTDSVSLESILLDGQRDRPAKPQKAQEVTQSSTTQPEKEEGQKKEQEKRNAAAAGQVASGRVSPGHSKPSTSPKRIPRVSSQKSRQSPNAHHSRVHTPEQEEVKGVTSPNIESQTASTVEKAAAAASARSTRLKQPRGET